MSNTIVTNLLMNNRGFVAGARGGQTAMKGLVGTVVAGSAAIMSALAPLTGIFAGIFAARAAIGGARAQIREEQKLAAVLNSTGMAAGLTSDAIKEYASARQALTNFGDEGTLGSAAILATFKDVSGDMFLDTMTAAQDMATVMGSDLPSAALMLGKALNMPAEGLDKLARSGVQFTDQQEEQIRAMQASGDLMGAQTVMLKELESQFGGAAEAVVEPWAQLKNTLGDVAENMGNLVLPSINAVTSALNEQMGGIAGASGFFKEMGTIGLSVFQNLGSAAEVVWARFQLGVTTIALDTMDVFTRRIPSYFSYVVDNGANLFANFLTFTTSVFENLSLNIRSAMEEIWTFIKSAGTEGLDFTWTPLTDGWVNTLKEMRDLPARAITQLEREMQANLDRVELDFSNIVASDIVAAQASQNAATFAQGMLSGLEDDTDMELPDSAPTSSQGRAESSAGALDARTREAVAAVARATNQGRDPAVRLAERQLVQQQEINAGIEDLTDHLKRLPVLMPIPNW